MPAKSGKGGAQLKSKYENYVGSMTGPRTKACMAKVLSAGMTNAKENAPLEYGTLINSAFRRIEGSRGNWRGIAGYSGGMTEKGFNYAFWLHENTNWSPVAPEDKQGPAWNPFAVPKFLELGFTGPLAREEIQGIISSEYRKK